MYQKSYHIKGYTNEKLEQIRRAVFCPCLPASREISEKFWIQPIRIIWHHERYDGRGYPDGLKGTDIPEEARIIGVADAYDAMTSNRSYRTSMPQEKVREQIETGAGTQFDPGFAKIMLEMIDEDTAYRMREM